MSFFTSIYPATRRRVSSDASAAERRRWLAEADAIRRWKEQYFQEKSCMDLPGIGQGNVLFTTTKVKAVKTRFVTPFAGLGNIEVMAGPPQENFSSGHSCLGLIKTSEDSYTPADVLLFPFSTSVIVILCWNPSGARRSCAIEQIIVLPATGLPAYTLRKMFRVIIVPTACTGMTPWRLDSPELVYFGRPGKKADKVFKAAAGKRASEEATYISVLGDVLNEQLLPFHKEVVMFIDGDHTGPDPVFRCDTTTKLQLSGGEERVKGMVTALVGRSISSTRTYRYTQDR